MTCDPWRVFKLRLLPSWAVQDPVTSMAERDEVGLIIVARMAPRLEMMDLQVLHGSAALTVPVIALKHAATEFTVFVRGEPYARSLGANGVHKAFPLACSRNV